ncbi:family 2 glycosyl transferase [Mesorhizobium helmanticense]|uniref:Family 2 glycosyl transferase n=1 Tax=Mesorhizobium helmanticense TaxID=1776423 RepID=A0A2T4IY83_9HYPH|nr:family 2 glycosyl transferase [Mesorhizobium helmanticense]
MTRSGETRLEVTVVIPARNAAATIDAALLSLIPDRDLIGEILLIDDGSDDRTATKATESAQRYGLPLEVVNVRLGSAGAARNVGIAQAKGKSIFFLDADDELIRGGLSLLYDALERNPGAGLAIGASIRRTRGRPDKLKAPHGYTSDRTENARRYLRNELWPIAMGSALISTAATAAIRFPSAIGLDEDTCYWVAMLARYDAATISAPVLLYHHDEARMAQRFISAPRRTFLAIALELDRLAGLGVDRNALQWRKAWIAQRISRQLIRHKMYADAAAMMRAVRAHKISGRSWKAFQYSARIHFGNLVQGHVPDTRFSRPAPNRGKERRTLVLCYDPAFPPVSGADLRNHGNAVAAAELGSVCLVSIRPQPDPSKPADTRIRTAALTLAGEARTASIGWWRTGAEKRISRAALKRLEAIIRAFEPDSIVVEGIALFKLLRPLRPLAGQLILDMHNVESDLAGQLQGADTTRSTPAAYGVRRLERKALGIVDRAWVCSRLDHDKLAALSRREVPIDIVPNGIPRFEDIAVDLPAEAAMSESFPVILFIGHLGYQPNIDAAGRLARAILPRIQERLPMARLVLAGRYPKPAVKALSGLQGVDLVENPDDLRPLLARAHLSIIPLSAGGGTRIKILEAMAWGIPVIATPLAVEGLDMVDGEEVLLSDTDEGLAGLAIELCLDRMSMARQRARAHESVWSRFGPAAISNAVSAGFGLDDAGT